MLTESDFHELLEYSPEIPVVSVYLNTEPVDGGVDVHKRFLRGMLKHLDLPADTRLIEKYIEHEYDWTGRSVAIFSCAPHGWFRTYPLAVVVRSRLRVSDKPHVKPLADLYDTYGGYGVALVNKQGGRFFYFHLGELREQEGISGENVRRTKRGGGSQVQGRRGGTAGQTSYTEELVNRNLKEVADFASSFFADNNVRRVLIGGTDDTVALFRSQLPKAWQSLVVGTFPMQMTATHTEVQERAMQVGQEAERKREQKLVNAVVTAAAKGRGGVIRLDDTLGAVHEGRVQTLLISEGLRAPGYRCAGCGYLTAQKVEVCPFCGGKFTEIADAVEMVVRQVMQAGGDVEVLHGNTTLEKSGNIGALLRY